MPVVLSVEGPDGAGKGEAIGAMKKALSERGLSICVIEKDSTPLLKQLSGLIVLSDFEDDPAAISWEDGPGYLARVSREMLKARYALNCGADVVIIDRFLLSAATHLLLGEIDSALRRASIELLRSCELTLPSHSIVLCTAPFDVCWQRVTSRTELSRKEQKGPEFNRRFHELVSAEETSRTFRAPVHRLDTSGSVSETHAQAVAICARVC